MENLVVERPEIQPQNEGGNFSRGKSKDTQKARLVEITANIMNTTKDNVYKVLRGEHNNHQIFSCYMELLERESELIESVKQLVPFP